MEKIESFVFKNKLIISAVMAAVLWACMASAGHAATIDVVSGSDGLSVDSNCTLSEAITNINNGDAVAYPECAGTGSFGSNDTINLPSGTITLTADLPVITESIAIVGQGMGASTVDGASNFKVFEIDNGSAASTIARGFKVQAYAGIGLVANAGTTDFSEIEVDGANAVAGSSNVGLGFSNNSGGDYTVSMKNLYVHDITNLAYNTNVIGLFFAVGDGANITAEIENVTVENIVAQNLNDTAQGIGVLNGPFQNGDSAQLDITIRNATVSNVSSDTGNSAGIGLTTFNDDASTSGQTRAKVVNSTITGVSVSNAAIVAAGIGSTVAGTTNGAQVGAAIELTNNVIADATNACAVNDMSTILGNTGVVADNMVISRGGNLADDNSCSAYFTHQTDQNNIAGLVSTLGALGNNGGFVPTIPLLANSPAVDGGVVVAGLSTDARGAVRPQGTAFDSGAYESSFSRAASTNESGGAPSQTLAATGFSLANVVMLGSLLCASGFGFLLVSRKHLV